MKNLILKVLAWILNKYCGHADGFFNITQKDSIYHVSVVCKRCGIRHDGDVKFVDGLKHPLCD